MGKRGGKRVSLRVWNDCGLLTIFRAAAEAEEGGLVVVVTDDLDQTHAQTKPPLCAAMTSLSTTTTP
jgi:hypothetical protein